MKARGSAVRFLVFTLNVVAALVGLSLAVPHSAAADRYWTGNVNGYLSVAGNWSNNVAPVTGDNLFFTTLIATFNYVLTNDYAPGTTFGKLTIGLYSKQSYSLSGSRIVLTNGLTMGGAPFSSIAVIYCDVTLGGGHLASQTFSVTRPLYLNGHLDVNDKSLTLTNTSTVAFDGFVSVGDTNYQGSIIKTGTGTLTIPAGGRLVKTNVVAIPGSAYYIPLYVEEGSLNLDGAITNDTGTCWVSFSQPYGPVTLSGTGILDVFAGTAIVSPGDGGPGIFQCTSVQYASPTLLLEINGTNAGTQYDQVVTSDPTAWPENYDIRLGYAPQLDDTFLIIRQTGPYGTPSGYGAILDLTNGYSLGIITSTNGFSLATVRLPDSPFVLWKGQTNFYPVNTLWSQTNHWAQGLAPVSGSRVRFSQYGYPHATITNDFPTGNSIASLEFISPDNVGNDYVLTGNALTLTEGITNRTSGGTNTILFDLVTVGPQVFDIGTGGALRLGGSFNGSGTVHKQGDGTLICTGTTMNIFVGSVAVDSGSLRMDGSFTDGSFTVNDGTLGGTGTVSTVTMNGGTLSPGDSPGIFHILGDLTMTTGAVFQVELNGPVAGSSYDQLQVNGAVNLNGATLSVLPGYTAAVGTAFLVLVNDASDPIIGTFAGLPEGAVFSAGGQYFSISYKAGSGNNDVLLTRVNAPGSFTGISRVDAGTVQLQGIGASNANYTVQANTNLSTTNWLNVGTVQADGSGNFLFNDTNVLSFPQRFFRLLVP